MREEPLTTGDVAKYCHVTPTTIGNWIKGRGVRGSSLKAYTTPGGHYRIFCKSSYRLLRRT